MSEFTWHLPELPCPLCNCKALHVTSERHGTLGIVETVIEIYCANYDCRLNDDDWEAGCGFRAAIECYKPFDCDCGGAHNEL